MSLPWFKFEPKPFISDTLRLSTEAKGAYLMLILDYYDQGKPAPDDDETLATITGLSVEVWRRHRRVIEPLFSVRDGLWYHNKCEEVLAEQIASYQQKVDASNAAAEARRLKKLAKQSGGKSSGGPVDAPSGQPVDTSFGEPSGDRPVEPDFGPSNRADDRAIDRAVNRPDNRAVENTAKQPTDAPGGTPSDTPNGQPDGLQNRRIEEGIREGANAPSPASVGFDHIGSLIDPAFQPTAKALREALNEGVPSTELVDWLDGWKQRCLDEGMRSTDWHAAWDREFHRRMQERAKARPKPRVTVSRKQRLTKIPDGWSPNEGHYKIAAERNLDIGACVDSFADYIVNKHPDWRDADASFRNWLKSPHRTEFKRNGQASQRRAPAPGGGSSILDAGARFEQRLDAELAAASGHRTDAEDQPHGDAPVLGLPQE